MPARSGSTRLARSSSGRTSERRPVPRWRRSARARTAKRLAVAYMLFKLIAAVIALVLFPFVTPLLVRASNTIDGVTLLAAYHTAYNVIGVAVLLPLIDKFTRLVERILPERGSAAHAVPRSLSACDPIAAVEAVRRTVARALGAACASIGGEQLQAGEPEGAWTRTHSRCRQAGDALRQAQVFMSEWTDRRKQTTSNSGSRAHCTRSTTPRGWPRQPAASLELETATANPDDARAGQLCAQAMRERSLDCRRSRGAAGVEPSPHEIRAAAARRKGRNRAEEALAQLERCATSWRSCGAATAARR